MLKTMNDICNNNNTIIYKIHRQQIVYSPHNYSKDYKVYIQVKQSSC